LCVFVNFNLHIWVYIKQNLHYCVAGLEESSTTEGKENKRERLFDTKEMLVMMVGVGAVLVLMLP
jgi:hypothetical protein